MKKNFKTTLFGITSILGGVTTIIKGDYSSGVTAIFAGFGLLFAKDY